MAEAVVANTLMVFVNPGQKIDQHFMAKYFSQVKNIATKYDLTLEIRDGSAGILDAAVIGEVVPEAQIKN